MAMSDYHSNFFTLEEHDPVVVATIVRSELSEEENIDVLGKQLLDLVEQRGCRQIVVSLQHVTYITSAALGKLITLHRRLHRKDGRLIICCAFNSVKDVMRTSRLHEYFTVADDVASALTLLSSPG